MSRNFRKFMMLIFLLYIKTMKNMKKRHRVEQFWRFGFFLSTAPFIIKNSEKYQEMLWISSEFDQKSLKMSSKSSQVAQTCLHMTPSGNVWDPPGPPGSILGPPGVVLGASGVDSGAFGGPPGVVLGASGVAFWGRKRISSVNLRKFKLIWKL